MTFAQLHGLYVWGADAPTFHVLPPQARQWDVPISLCGRRPGVKWSGGCPSIGFDPGTRRPCETCWSMIESEGRRRG